jgi:hypothetical protein
MHLKPQDTLLALKYWSLKQGNSDSSVRDIAESTGISASEVSKGSRRLVTAGLVVEHNASFFTEPNALFEWLSYGVRYAYPQKSVGYGRGIATSWNCPGLESEIVPAVPAWVWPASGGEVEGVLIQPFYSSVPFSASRDKHLYRVMSLLEAIRGGEPRALAIARTLLTKLIKGDDENTIAQ